MERGSPLSSPASSPRTPDSSHNYNIDASGSTYALQVLSHNLLDMLGVTCGGKRVHFTISMKGRVLNKHTEMIKKHNHIIYMEII